MLRAIAILILAAGLAGCDVITALVDGAKHAKAVETDLEQATGIKPRRRFQLEKRRAARGDGDVSAAL